MPGLGIAREVNDTHGAGQSRIHLTSICQIDNQILLSQPILFGTALSIPR